MTDSDAGLADLTHRVSEPDDELGVKQSPVLDRLIVDDRAWDDSDQPDPRLEKLTHGDTVVVAGQEAEVAGWGERANFGQRGLFRIGLWMDGRLVSLFVDRDPYLLRKVNGGIYVIEPDEVEIRD